MITPTRRRGWRRLFSIKFWLLLVSLVVLLGAGASAVAYTLVDVPDPNQAARAQTSIIYFADGKTEMARLSAVNREAVELDRVPVHMRHAMLAAEDRSFYDNPGVSLVGIGRAVWAAISGGPTQGGSTITQQYVKNYFLTQDQTLSRKFREIVISLKVEQELSKDEILRDYLNTIYFGRGAYGIQAASKAYFDKNVEDLTVGESAFLASVIRGPSLYDPALGDQQKKNARGRVNYVLDGMVEQGWLSASARKDVTFPEFAPVKEESRKSGPNGYLVQMVKDELVAKVGLTQQQVDMGGLRVVTTIDQQRQQDAIRAVENNLPTPKVRTGLVSMRPGDGAIVALYGGANFAKQPYNAATQAQLQGGSTFKAFTLVAALEKGIGLRTQLDASSPRYFDAFKGGGNSDGEVHNYGDASLGWITLETATAKSANTAFADLNLQVGPEATRDVAVRLGLPAETLGLSDNPANVFGTASPRVIDMARAYGTLAARGVRADPYIVKRVTGVGENFRSYDASPVTEKVLEQDVVDDAVQGLRQVVLRGTAQKAQQIGRPAAGKTGTTDENRAVWFDGFTPDLVTAVAMYLPDENGNAVPMRGAGLGSGVTGGSYPVDVWTSYMRRAVDGTEWKDFPPRAGIGRSWGRSDQGSDQQTQQPQDQGPQQTSDASPSSEPTVTWSPTDVPPPPITDAPQPTQTQDQPDQQAPQQQPTQTADPQTSAPGPARQSAPGGQTPQGQQSGGAQGVGAGGGKAALDGRVPRSQPSPSGT